MALRIFSEKNRPIDLGSFRLESLPRQDSVSLDNLKPFEPLSFKRENQPHSIVNAMRDHQAMLDAIRDGLINKVAAETPADLDERARHLKSFGYFADASMVGICRLPSASLLDQAYRNPDIDRLADDLRKRQTKTLASGIDLIMADLKESMEAEPTSIDGHTLSLIHI